MLKNLKLFKRKKKISMCCNEPSVPCFYPDDPTMNCLFCYDRHYKVFKEAKRKRENARDK